MADLGILTVPVVPDMGDFQSQVSGAMSSITSGVGRITATVGRDLANIGTSVVAAAGIGVASVATVGIKMAAGLEQAELQFTTLLGSADAAKAKVADLFEFAKRTPFESGPVIEASRRLQVFGGDALNTAENLERIGDAAATTAAPIEDVAFWAGRLFSQIQGGQKFGEAAMRLQELGVLTPEVRTKMEELSDAGASADEIFGQFQGHLDEFSGAMDRQAGSWTGLISTIKDQFAIGAKDAFLPLFNVLEALLDRFRAFGDSPVFKAITDNIAEIVSLLLQGLSPVILRVADAMESLTETDVDQFFLDIREAMGGVVSGGGDLLDTFGPLLPVIAGVAASFLSMKASMIPLIGLIFPQVTGLTGALLGFTLGIKENRDALAGLGDVMGHAAKDVLPELQGSIKVVSDSMTTAFVGAIDALTPGLETLVRDVLPPLAAALAKLAPPLGRVIQELAELVSGFIVNAAPLFVGIAQGVGAILGAGLDVLADLFGVINDHMEIMGPLLVGVAGAFALFSFASWVGELKIVVSTVKTLNTALAAARAAAAASTGTGLFSSIIAGATAATGSVVALNVALDAIGIGLVIATIAAGFKHASDESKKFKKTVEGISDDIQDLGREGAAFQAALDFSRQGDLGEALTRVAGGAQNLGEKLRGSQADWDAFINRLRDQGLDTFGVQALNRLHSAYKDADEAAKEAAKTEEATAATREESKKAIDNQSQALRDLRDAMDEALNKNLGVAESEVKLRDTLAGMSGQVAELAAQGINVAGAFDAATNSFDLNTEAGRRGTDLVTGAISNFQGFEQAILGSGESAEEMQGQLDSLYNQMVTQTAQAFGITDDQAKAMLETFGLTPDKLETDVNLKSEEATREAEELATRLNNLPGVPEPLAAQISAAIQSGDLETADALLSGWEAKYRNDPPTVKVNVSVDYDAIREFDRNAANQFRNQRGPAAASSQGVAMMGPGVMGPAPLSPTLLGADATIDVALRPRVLTGPTIDSANQASQQRGPVYIENRVFLGDQEVKQLVRQEARVMERDRSLAYIGTGG